MYSRSRDLPRTNSAGSPTDSQQFNLDKSNIPV